MRDKALYTGLLIALTLMVVFSLGGGLWGAEQTIGHWTGSLFQSICHQNPERSFSFMGTQMAVNTRCFGIFSGIWVGWLLIPLYLFIDRGKKPVLLLLIVAAIAQIIDFGSNVFSIWTNTNTSRYLLGFTLGTAASLYIGELFKSSTKSHRNERSTNRD